MYGLGETFILVLDFVLYVRIELCNVWVCRFFIDDRILKLYCVRKSNIKFIENRRLKIYDFSLFVHIWCC